MERTGIYFRVLNQGQVRAGDTVTLIENDNVSILDLFRFSYDIKHDTEELRRFLQVPVAQRFRVKIESKLEDSEQASDEFRFFEQGRPVFRGPGVLYIFPHAFDILVD